MKLKRKPDRREVHRGDRGDVPPARAASACRSLPHPRGQRSAPAGAHAHARAPACPPPLPARGRAVGNRFEVGGARPRDCPRARSSSCDRALISLPLRIAKPVYSPPLTTCEPAGQVATEVPSLPGSTLMSGARAIVSELTRSVPLPLRSLRARGSVRAGWAARARRAGGPPCAVQRSQHARPDLPGARDQVVLSRHRGSPESDEQSHDRECGSRRWSGWAQLWIPCLRDATARPPLECAQRRSLPHRGQAIWTNVGQKETATPGSAQRGLAKPERGLEPLTSCLQDRCSTS